MRRSLAVFGIALAATLIGSPGASACSCLTVGPGEPDYRWQLQFADAVFQGIVREVRDLESIPLKLIVFDADAAWKGVKASRVLIFTGWGGGDCGFDFEVGKKYLVWAKRNESQAPGELAAGTCSPTASLESAGVQLTQLGRPKQLKQ
jgi:hypothetical protein